MVRVRRTVFTTRCYASAVLAMALCLSVCLSVTSRCSVKTAKRRITQTTPHDSPGTCFLTPKISAKFDRGHPLRGRQMQVRWVKIGDFRQITGYISKRYNIDAWFLVKSNRKSYALCRMVTLQMTLSDSEAPQTAPICTLCTASHIVIMGVVRTSNLVCMLTVASHSLPM